METVWPDVDAEGVGQQLRDAFLANYDSVLSDCFGDLYKLYIAASITLYLGLGFYMLSPGQPKHLLAVLLTGIVFGVKLAAGHYAFTQVASGSRHRLIEELAGQLSLIDGNLQFVHDTIRRFILPTDALFAIAQTTTPIFCLLLSMLFENKRPLLYIAVLAIADFCWLVATPNSFNFIDKLYVLDMIKSVIKMRAFVHMYV